MNTDNRPDAPLIGADGNIFNLIGIASRSLQQHGFQQEAAEMKKRVMSCHSYEEALNTITEYVNPVEQAKDRGTRPTWNGPLGLEEGNRTGLCSSPLRTA